MELPDPSFADEFNISPEYAVFIFNVRRAVVSIPVHVHLDAYRSQTDHLLECLFRIVDEGPDEVQYGNLANLPNVFASYLDDLWKVGVVAFCIASAFSPPFFVLCCGYLSLHTMTRALTRCSAPALRARCQFSHSGKHDVGHVGGNVTDAGAIGGWW